MVDMAHFAGLVAGGAHPSPLPHAHVVTTTTHKTLRGPRGGMILANDEEIGKKINSAVFPGLQGGPLMHVIAAKAVAFGEALRPEFKLYAQAVVDNAQARWPRRSPQRGLAIVSGGTDTHLMLVDLRPKKLTGRAAESALERAGITCNKNGIPFDPGEADDHLGRSARHARPARPAASAGRIPPGRRADRRGARRARRSNGDRQSAPSRRAVRGKVEALCARFPIYR